MYITYPKCSPTKGNLGLWKSPYRNLVAQNGEIVLNDGSALAPLPVSKIRLLLRLRLNHLPCIIIILYYLKYTGTPTVFN